VPAKTNAPTLLRCASARQAERGGYRWNIDCARRYCSRTSRPRSFRLVTPGNRSARLRI